MDCGHIPIVPVDNAVAQRQMTEAFTELGSRRPLSPLLEKPKLITLGGDHSLALPALRALNKIYGKPLRVLHFDGKAGHPLEQLSLAPTISPKPCMLS